MSATSLDPGSLDPDLAASARRSTPLDHSPPYHHDGENEPAHSSHDEDTKAEYTVNRYWSENVRLLLSLLGVWFAVSFGAGILFVEQLNNFQLGGYPLGFWFAQQGSIYVFVALIFFYSHRMKIIERRYGVDDDGE